MNEQNGTENTILKFKCCVGRTFENPYLQMMFEKTLEQMVNAIVPTVAAECHKLLADFDKALLKSFAERREELERKQKGDGR